AETRASQRGAAALRRRVGFVSRTAAEGASLRHKSHTRLWEMAQPRGGSAVSAGGVTSGSWGFCGYLRVWVRFLQAETVDSAQDCPSCGPPVRTDHCPARRCLWVCSTAWSTVLSEPSAAPSQDAEEA